MLMRFSPYLKCTLLCIKLSFLHQNQTFVLHTQEVKDSIDFLDHPKGSYVYKPNPRKYQNAATGKMLLSALFFHQKDACAGNLYKNLSLSKLLKLGLDIKN